MMAMHMTTFAGVDAKPVRRAMHIKQGHEHDIKAFTSSARRPGYGASTRVAAAASTAEMALAAGACYLPHPDKADTGGEDAHFIASNGLSMGVADGVGGWRESGVDPGDYSRQLMKTACAFFEENHDKRTTLGNMKAWEEWARQALVVAHAKTRLPGSSTACVLVLNPDNNWLSAANLGDSGFVVVRNGTVVFQTPALQHFFDCPYQFGAFPEYVEATDYPSDAQTFSLNVMAGDIIVMGSDGLFDNCPLDEIVALLPDKDDDVTTSAERVAALARKHASDPEFDSPYIMQALEQGMDLPWWEKIANTRIKDGKLQVGRLSGGKLDDITVLVARVSDAPVQVSAEEAPLHTEEAPAPVQEPPTLVENAVPAAEEATASAPEEPTPKKDESMSAAGVEP